MKNIDWSNDDNIEFYEKTPVETHKNWALAGGLADHSDLGLIYRYIDRSGSILEVGAGYGRVLEYLLKIGFEGCITALERNHHYFELLKKQYSHRVNLIPGDIKEVQLSGEFDLILWMWSGISDFTPIEQIQVLKKLSNYLSSNGYLIIDTFSHAEKPMNALDAQSQAYHIVASGASLHGYISSPAQMKKYAKKIGLNSYQYIPYLTSANRPRALYIFTNAYSFESIEL